MRSSPAPLLGIGLAIVRHYLDADIAGVVAVDLAPGLPETLTRKADPSRLKYLRGDVGIEQTAGEFTRIALDSFGRIDILVNNAGISVVKALHEHTPEEWDAVMNTNVKAMYWAARHVIPVMIRQQSGVILNTGSISGRWPACLTQGAYGPSKGAVHQMTRQMAIEYAPHGIRVNAIGCGTVDTPIVHKSAAASGDPEEFWAMLRDNHPIGRIASPEEVAGFFTYMASDLASFFTGVDPHDGRRIHGTMSRPNRDKHHGLELRDHTVVVVGGASGIGLAPRAAFAAEGARVVLWDRSETVAEIAAATGVNMRGAGRLESRWTSQTNRRSGWRSIRPSDAFGHVDHLVHAAAIGSGKFGFPFTNLKPADWPRVLQVNVMGMVNVAHAVGPAHGRAPGRDDGVRRLGGRADRLADRPALQRVEGGQHQFRPVHGQGPGSARRPRQHRLPGHGADAAEPLGLAGVARPDASRRSG